MTLADRSSPRADLPARRKPLRGEVLFLYAFDIAYEMRGFDRPTLLGQPVAQFSVDASKRSPRHLFFYRPQMIRLPPDEKLGPDGPVRLEAVLKLLPVGALSVTIRLSVEADSLDQLVRFHDLRFNDGLTVTDYARDLAERARRELSPFLFRPRPGLSDEEAYTIFFVNSLAESEGFDAATWLEAHRRDVAALLTEESNAALLSEQEVAQSTSVSISYSRQDLLVLDWDAALVIEEPRSFPQLMYTIELANMQLTELEAYDRILDETIERSYRDLSSAGRYRGLPNIRRELREIRIDLARMTDELSNITKFFGDWHVARVYQALSRRFHLPDWKKTIDHKLQTLNDIYGLLATDRANRTMIFLEAAIVLLIVFEIVQSFIR